MWRGLRLAVCAGVAAGLAAGFAYAQEPVKPAPLAAKTDAAKPAVPTEPSTAGKTDGDALINNLVDRYLSAAKAVIAQNTGGASENKPAILPPSADLLEKLHKKISVASEDLTASGVLFKVGKQAGINVAWSPRADSEQIVTLDLTDVSAESALFTIARMADLKVEYIGDVVFLDRDRRQEMEDEARLNRPVGTLEMNMGAQTFKLNLLERDVPPDVRERIIHRILADQGIMVQELEGGAAEPEILIPDVEK